MCCFHPAYGYEDFLEGYRPESVDGRMNFVLRDGIFKTLCKDANSNPDRNFYLIIDEINRGDIPRIFGELLTILEKDKRGKSILLPLSSEQFQIPKNVFIIGTMNTADRSIALLVTALRRRFGFIELMPDTAILGDAVVNGIPIGRWLEELNRRICAHVGRDARNLQVGHSYLMEGSKPIQDFHRLSRVIREDIIPLLEEYCYEDYSSLEKILGPGLVDSANQKIRHDLFEDGGQENLIRALLQPCPDIATSLQVVAAESKVPEDEGEELEGGTPSAVK
jgi:5-methylcytosine-specific restriction protein B